MSAYWPVRPDDWPFTAVYILPVNANSISVSWDLAGDIFDNGPWMFSLQINSEEGDPDKWVALTEPEEDISVITVTFPEHHGKTLFPYIRVKLQTGGGTYYSKAQSLAGISNRQMLLYSQAIVRRMSVERLSQPRKRGWLLKRKISGARCICYDALTNMETKSSCTACYGTGIVGGYWKAASMPMLLTGDKRVGESWAAGQQNNVMLSAVLVGLPIARIGDFFVDSVRNERYAITAANTIDLMGVPIASTAKLELVHPKHIIHSFSV